MTGLIAALLVSQALQPAAWENWSNFDQWGTVNSQVLNIPFTSSGAGFDCTGSASCVSWVPSTSQNYILQSQTISTGGAATSPWVGSLLSYINTSAGAPNGGSWTEIALSSASGTMSQAPITVPSGRSFSYTIAAKRVNAGTGTAQVFFDCLAGGSPTCTCSRTSGGSCTIFANGTDGCRGSFPGVTDTVTDWLTVDAVCLTDRTTVGASFAAPTGTSAAAIGFSNAHLRPTSVTGPYTPTTTTAQVNPLVINDAAGWAWTENGSVPKVAANLLPVTSAPGAAGPFSTSNYYAATDPSDGLDTTGDRFGCVAFNPATAISGTRTLFYNGLSGTAGYGIELITGAFRFYSHTPTAVQVTQGFNNVANSLVVACWWRTGTTIYIQANLQSVVSNASAGTEVAGTAYTARIGRDNPGTNSFDVGPIIHMVQGIGACPTPPPPFANTCSSWSSYQQKRYLGLLGTRSNEAFLTRATAATTEVNGRVWNTNISAPRITPSGILLERTATNFALQSENSCTAGGAVVSPWSLSGGLSTCLGDQAVAPDGNTTMDQVSSTGNTSGITQATTFSPTTTQTTASMWMRRGSSGTTTMINRCVGGTVSACTCGRADGGACTPTTGSPTAADCIARFTSIGTTPVRGWVTATCATTTTWALFFFPGDYGTSTGTAEHWGSDHEAGSAPTSYISTVSSSVTRNGDAVTVTRPSGINPRAWCIEGTWTPTLGASWLRTLTPNLISIGSLDNSMIVQDLGTGVIRAGMVDASSVTRYYDYTLGSSSPGSKKLTFWTKGGVTGLKENDVPVLTRALAGGSTAEPGVFSVFDTPITLSVIGPNTGDNILRDFRLYRSPTCR